MRVRDLACWPPKWRRATGGSTDVARGEDGVLISVRCDLATASLTLGMEHEGDRHFARLENDPVWLTRLSLLLDWHVGRPLARIGALEIGARSHPAAPAASGDRRAGRARPGAGD